MEPRTALRLAVLAVAVATAPACVVDAHLETATGSFERTLVVDGPVDLAVRTGSGSIQVRTGTDDTVRVVGRIRARSDLWTAGDPAERVNALVSNPPIVQRANSIEIGGIEDAALRRNVSISYELTVPGETRLRSDTGSGSLDIESVRGPVEARAGSGRISIGRVAGRVTATTGSGSIEVAGAGDGLVARAGSGSVQAREIQGSLEAQTGSGRIDVSYAGGEADVTTGSGGITIRGAGGRLRASTGSGTIAIEGEPVGDWMVRTSSGGINLRLPPTAAFDLDAHTSSGSITADHPVEMRGALSRRSLQGQVRGGGPRVDLSTSSGSIRLQ